MGRLGVLAAVALCASGLLWSRSHAWLASRSTAAANPCHTCFRRSIEARHEEEPAANEQIVLLLSQVSQEGSTPAALEIAPGPPNRVLSLGPGEIAALASRCAPTSPASLIQAIVKVESGGRPFLVSVNGNARHVIAAASREQVSPEIARLKASGANFDTGLMQLNSATLKRLRVSPEATLDPCRNIALGAKLFEEGYARAFAAQGLTSPLLSAYSSYNTGDLRRGLVNGYAGRVDTELRATAGSRASS